MSDDLTGLEVLFLWRLAAAGGGEWMKGVKPDPGAPSRGRLARLGLIEQEKRGAEGGGRKLMHLALTDRGWRWLAEHLGDPIATRSPAALEILVRLLARLRVHLDAGGLSLAEFIQPGPPTAEGGPDGLDKAIEAAYLSLSGGSPNVRVRLADLRDATEMPREAFDATMLGMASSGRASLYRLDNPTEIGPRDRDATLRTPSGEERHIVYLGGRGS